MLPSFSEIISTNITISELESSSLEILGTT
jgi:hypothetical protein